MSWLLAAGLMVAGGDSLYFGTRGSDLVTYFYPNRVFVHRWLARGVWPMWNPHVFGGYPVLESQQMALLNVARMGYFSSDRSIREFMETRT